MLIYLLILIKNLITLILTTVISRKICNKIWHKFYYDDIFNLKDTFPWAKFGTTNDIYDGYVKNFITESEKIVLIYDGFQKGIVEDTVVPYIGDQLTTKIKVKQEPLSSFKFNISFEPIIVTSHNQSCEIMTSPQITNWMGLMDCADPDTYLKTENVNINVYQKGTTKSLCRMINITKKEIIIEDNNKSRIIINQIKPKNLTIDYEFELTQTMEHLELKSLNKFHKYSTNTESLQRIAYFHQGYNFLTIEYIN